MEDRVTITALEVDIVFPTLEVKHASFSFEVGSTLSFFEADHTFSALEVKETSSLDITSAKKASTSLDVEITSPSFTYIEFASSISNYKHSEVTSPIYTYQHSEVASFSSNCQDMEVTSPSNYQYNLKEEDTFDDWQSIDKFMHLYCLERGFGYQIFRNDKDPNNSSITCRKFFRCSANGTYNARKNINQNLHHLCGNTNLNCEWHCNFTFPKTIEQIRNVLSTELFEQWWQSIIETFPECHNYITRTLYNNCFSWAKSYASFQFNARIQSTQSVESFNGIIKKSLSSASTLCDVEKAIEKRLEDES
ncbi:28795_t:CDS:2 [Gigaspora margarita]|uniref:28795_t:CDS:1 n=1 Tax=Gigaspora margarita TaxID=4874 RepID=A0ABN7UVT6_GIGMA|nr:28795_t:CDS:2 [Gigaspora margarita]